MKKRGIALLAAALLCAGMGIAPVGAVTRAEGNHAQWIDRVCADPVWPEATRELYAWLEQEGAKGADGALGDITKAPYFADYGVYGYELAVLENEEPIRFRPAADKTKNQQAAWAAILAYMTDSGMEAAIRDIADYAMTAMNAFDRDHPEVFWVTGAASVMMPISYTYSDAGEVNFTQRIIFCLSGGESGDIRLEQYRDPAAIRRDIAALDDAVQSILGELPDGTRQQQLSYLTDYLTEHNSYSSASSSGNAARSPLTALRGSTEEAGPVCEGYARAFKILCDRLEIPCVLVSGTARHSTDSTGEPHMWNLVQMEDGAWYAVDVTWNDPVARNTDGQRIRGAVSGYENRDYFLIGQNSEVNGLRFGDSHTVKNQVSLDGFSFTNGPNLADDAYTPGSAPRNVAVTIDGETAYFADFDEAMAAANGKRAEIRLLADARSGGIAPKRGTSLTLDLNGFTLSGNVGEGNYLLRVTAGTAVTLTDSSEAQSGRLTSDGGVLAAKGGTLRIECGL